MAAECTRADVRRTAGLGRVLSVLGTGTVIALLLMVAPAGQSSSPSYSNYYYYYGGGTSGGYYGWRC